MAGPNKQPLPSDKPRSVEEWLSNIVASSRTQDFWGEVVIVFEKGNIVRVYRKQSLFPPGKADNPGGSSPV